MGHRLSRIYTRTGDDGTTGLGDGSRVRKDHPRVAAFGTVDELNSAIGVVLAHLEPGDISGYLQEIQHELFDLGGELCIPGQVTLTQDPVTRLENRLDALNSDLPPLKDFVLPGGNREVAFCHMARAICRRAERRLVTLSRAETVNPDALTYLNRLADLLFVMARSLGRRAGCE